MCNLQVYETREEISKDQNLLQVQLGGLNSSSSALPSVESSSSAEICLARSGYLGLVLSLVGLLAVALVAVVVAIVCYGRVRKMQVGEKKRDVAFYVNGELHHAMANVLSLRDRENLCISWTCPPTRPWPRSSIQCPSLSPRRRAPQQ